ncbi:MAG: cob(I)yrinic acid a,c-diamide adenosyltransferase [Alphaproteobacteria bacterium]
MVQLTHIYTRSGDTGRASLGDGTRRKKSDIRFETIGNVDEVNAYCGLIAVELPTALQKLITHIQNDLFDLGADLAVPQGEALRIGNNHVEFLEKQIDIFNDALNPLDSFVLPGGTKASALMHVARTVVRRAERSMVLLNEYELVNGNALKYLNRLSDLLFVLCRHLNDNGKLDVLWVPGANR